MTEIEDFELGGEDALGEIEAEAKDGFDILQSEHVNHQTKDYFYIWDIGFECARRKYYDMVKPIELPWAVRRKLSVGAGIHKEWQLAFKKVGYLIEEPLKVVINGITYSSKLDAIKGTIEMPEKLVEIKTTAYMKYLQNPYAGNLAQIQMYFKMLNLNYGYLFYVDAIGGKPKEFKVFRDDNIIESNIAKVEFVNEALHLGMLPEKTKNKYCRSCQRRKECEENCNIV